MILGILCAHLLDTAALPWRTGTAVNPFLRALYFIKRRMDLGLYQGEKESDDTKRVGKVTLVIPWLVDLDDATKLYGSHITKTGEEGKQEQEEWIRNYGTTQCDMKGEFW